MMSMHLSEKDGEICVNSRNPGCNKKYIF